MIDYARLGSALRRERMRQGLTLREVADRLGTESVGWLSAIEHARRTARLELIDRIADVLGLRLQVTARLVRR